MVSEMNESFLVLPVIFPILAGAILPFFKFKVRLHRNIYVEITTLITSLLVLAILLYRPEGAFTVLNLAGELEIVIHVDGLATVFAGLISALWPFATLYAFEYMEHEGHEDTFFAFYTMTFGVTVGIAFAANYMTLYMFYEMLTLVTLPLVMAGMSKEAILAGRKYILYSMGGAAFAFIGFVFIYTYGNTMDFVYGGVLNAVGVNGKEDLIRLAYVLSILGFGVKAAIFPFHGWLPTASIAPTPVTALLHAVAVVKAGAYAIIRITYYSFGTDFLHGSWAQNVVLAFAIITIVYGSGRAVKEPHFKRRLAYSTISNLSYVIFGALLMTPAGLVGALSHILFHAVMKITLFFCAGAILCKTERQWVRELDGLAYRMPVVWAVYTVSALALVGVPFLAGFISKWNLGTAAIEEGSFMAIIGVIGLLISALLTAVYMLKPVFRAYFPGEGFDFKSIEDCSDPTWRMKLPLIVFSVLVIAFGVYSQPVIAVFEKIAEGLI